jgi:hypothetical protein
MEARTLPFRSRISAFIRRYLRPVPPEGNNRRNPATMDERRATDIETRIREAIRGVCDALRDELRSTPWTLAIREALTRLGHELGCQVRGARPLIDPKKWDTEWLCDVTWVESDDEHTLLSVPLALESEWQTAPDEILWDFQKLLEVAPTSG